MKPCSEKRDKKTTTKNGVLEVWMRSMRPSLPLFIDISLPQVCSSSSYILLGSSFLINLIQTPFRNPLRNDLLLFPPVNFLWVLFLPRLFNHRASHCATVSSLSVSPVSSYNPNLLNSCTHQLAPSLRTRHPLAYRTRT